MHNYSCITDVLVCKYTDSNFYCSVRCVCADSLPFQFDGKFAEICDVICKNPSHVAKCKIDFWSHFKATSELFPELFKFCLNDIHIQSYN